MADTQIPQKTLTHSSHTVIQEEPKASFFSNIIAIIGFIILVTIVIWGLVNLAGISREWFASLFGSKKAAAIEVSAPATTTSGTPFTVSWKYNEPAKGTYAFLYQCRVGLQFKTSDEAGFSNDIPCGAAFTVAGTDKKFSVTPLLMGDSAVAVPLSIIFMPSSTSTPQAQGSATTTVIPAEIPVAPTPTPEPAPQPTPAPEPVPAPTPQPVSTPADLSVRITSVSTDAAGVTAVSFDIANVGGTSSGTYSFTANLPTQSGYTYASPTQASLAPSSHVLNTLRFTQAQSGVVSISLNASDANKSNNYASQSVSAPYYNNYNSSYNYQNTYYNAQTGGPYYTQPYQMYPYSQTAGYPYSPYAQGYGGTQYYQQQPYSTYYPYTY